jgi:hypothetical protein
VLLAVASEDLNIKLLPNLGWRWGVGVEVARGGWGATYEMGVGDGTAVEVEVGGGVCLGGAGQR